MTFGFQTEQDEAFGIMDAAYDGGVNFIDSADVYPIGSDAVGTTEEIVGAWLATKPRDSIVLATKCRGAMGPGPNDVGLSRGHIIAAVDASLRRLGTDYIDLYQMHFPDHATPIEETLAALDDVVRAGKVRYIGVSNYQAWIWRSRLASASASTWLASTATSPATTCSTARSRTRSFPSAAGRASASSPTTPWRVAS